MARFEYRFVKSATGRMNKRVASAYDEEILRANLARDGIEPTEVVRMPEPPATEAQLAYLRDLGVAPVSGLTLAEASDLITNTKERKSPSDSAGRGLAERYKIEITRFTSKETIYRLIVGHLLESDNVSALAEWYAFRVYRSRREMSLTLPLDSPNDPRFGLVARAIESDPQAVKSMLAAARSTETGFRWFGEYQGWQGDSDRSIAFQVAARALTNCGLLASAPTRSLEPPAPRARAQDTRFDPETVQREARNGCLGSFVIGVLCLAGLGFGFSLLAVPNI